MEEKVVRCSSCGGIEITQVENKNFGICAHCGSTVIMPRQNEEIIALLNSAYLQRANYDFDAAIKTYEFALDKDSNEKSAYEGLLLAKYGIEYVKDPRSKKLVPTCHRTHFKSVYEDEAYLSLVELCDEEEKEIIDKKLLEIEKLQKAIAKQLEREEDYDIFISYKATDENGEKTEDSIIARNIYDKLVEQNYKVFFSEKTLEDRLGSDYEPIIFKALHTAKMFILVGTKKEYVNSVWVKNEWTRFVDRIKTEDEVSSQSFIPVFKDMSPYDMPKVNNKFVQGVDASKLGYNIAVADGISKILKPKEEKDIIKTFNDFENVIEMKKAQKKSKQEYKKKQINKLKENKFKYGMFFTADILCFVLPLVMIGISFTQKFPFLQYCNFWIFLSLGILWIPCFVYVLIYRNKINIGQSALKIVLSSASICLALLFMIFTCLSDALYYAVWDMNTGSYAGVYSGGYYSTQAYGVKDDKILSLYDVKANKGNDFIVPEYIDGIKVELMYVIFGANIKTLYIDNKNIDGRSFSDGVINHNVYSIERVEITGEKRDNFYYQGSAKEHDIKFSVDELSLGLQNEPSIVNIKDSKLIKFVNSTHVGNVNIEKTSKIEFDCLDTCEKLSILGENDEVCIDSADWDFEGHQIKELIVKNTKKLTLIANYNSVQNIKIGKDIQNFEIVCGYMSPTTIYYEGSEQEWNLINKTIPAGITVLFNQSI